MVTHVSAGEYSLRYGCDAMDFAKVTAMLAGAFWCEGISQAEVRRGAENSALVVGAFHGGEQVGYARAISDRTRFAYILDVYVDKNCRRQGIGQMMVRGILCHEDLQDVYQWLLITKDAHGVYEKLGFRVTARSGDWMEIRSPPSRRQLRAGVP